MARPIWFDLRPQAISLCLLMAAAGPALALETCRISFSGGTRLTLPVARSWQDQQQGLSGRLDVGPGMLFLWQEAADRVLWMRNTYVPLTAIFLSPAGQVLKVVAMEPASDERHSAGTAVSAAIEIPSANFAATPVKTGESAILDCLSAPPDALQ